MIRDYFKILVYSDFMDILDVPTLGALAATNSTNWAKYGPIFKAKLLPWARSMLYAWPYKWTEHISLKNMQSLWQQLAVLRRHGELISSNTVSNNDLITFFMAKSNAFINRIDPQLINIPWLTKWPPIVDNDYFLDCASTQITTDITAANHINCGQIEQVYWPYIPSAITINPNNYKWSKCDPQGRAIWTEAIINEIQYRMIIVGRWPLELPVITMQLNPVSFYTVYLTAAV